MAKRNPREKKLNRLFSRYGRFVKQGPMGHTLIAYGFDNQEHGYIFRRVKIGRGLTGVVRCVRCGLTVTLFAMLRYRCPFDKRKRPGDGVWVENP